MRASPLRALAGRLQILDNRLSDVETRQQLAEASPTELAARLDEVADLHEEVYDLFLDHAATRPSSVWLILAVISGLGGLYLLDWTWASMVVSVGGAAGALKAIADLGGHLKREQTILGAYWRVDRLKVALVREMANRDIET
jgi:hypothetical protein